MKEEKFQRLIDSILLRYRAHIKAIFFFFLFNNVKFMLRVVELILVLSIM